MFASQIGRGSRLLDALSDEGQRVTDGSDPPHATLEIETAQIDAERLFHPKDHGHQRDRIDAEVTLESQVLSKPGLLYFAWRRFGYKGQYFFIELRVKFQDCLLRWMWDVPGLDRPYVRLTSQLRNMKGRPADSNLE